MPDFSQLTERQREIYDFITSKIESRGYGPTVREIGLAFDIHSPNGVMCHLKALEKKGLIIREGFSARAIQLVDHRPPSAGLPLLGAVAAGAPIEAVANEERLDFDDLFGGPDHFALKVRGQSMIEDHIDDGDYVVIRKQETARERRARGGPDRQRGDAEALLPRQGAHPPRAGQQHHEADRPRRSQAANAQILGVLVGVLRKC